KSGNDGCENIFHALLDQCTGKMVMINDVMVILGTEHGRNHMRPEKCPLFLCLSLPPDSPMLGDLAKADHNLRRAQFFERYRFQDGFPCRGHALISSSRCLEKLASPKAVRPLASSPAPGRV